MTTKFTQIEDIIGMSDDEIYYQGAVHREPWRTSCRVQTNLLSQVYTLGEYKK